VVCFCDELVLETGVEDAGDIEEDGLGRGEQCAEQPCWDVGEDLVDNLLRENRERHGRQVGIKSRQPRSSIVGTG
jgi:hypothetical protein